MRRSRRRFVKSPNLVAYWKEGAFILEEFERRRRITAAPLVISLLQAFDEPRTIAQASRRLPSHPSDSLERGVRLLVRLGFLVEPGRGRRPDLMHAWQESFPAIYYQCSSRDMLYVTDLRAKRRYVQNRLAEARQPPLFKRAARRTGIPLSHRGTAPRLSLDRVLEQRRTVRNFRSGSVAFSDFAAVIRGTFGQTGWVDSGPMGRLVIKTSPSAGARHPIECYVLAWRVDGLRPGLYYYDVRRNRLERLRSGNPQDQAVGIASGQKWIRGAAFLCVLTAVTDRVFWKYRLADAYRLFFLDAGHLGQTFALLATSRGLGPFTTAALQESRIEKILGIDGLREFPVYLCGAGLPLRSTATSPTVSDPIPSSTPR